MTYDKAGEADIRGINIDKLAKGFGELMPTFKNYAQKSKTSAREIRWYRKGVSLAAAQNPLDIATTNGVTGSMMANTSFKARPFVVEESWERQTSYVKKYFVESPLISIEDIKDSDIDVLAGNVRELVKAVNFKVDRRIYDVLTNATTSGTPNPSTVINTTASTDGWQAVATCNPILDLLNAKMEIADSGYNPEGAICLMTPLEHKSLLNFLINVKGSSIPPFATEKVKSGIVMELLGLKIAVSPNATDDWVITFLPSAITWKSFLPLTSVVIDEAGIGKKIRVWEEGEGILTDPRAVHIISDASA